MYIAGITAEYNPFHLGHAYQLEMVRQSIGPDAPVFAVMSGDFVQRGEAACFDKFARAEAACACGINAVFELPLPWACATAEVFAAGAVRQLAAVGVTDLFFGAEDDDITALENAAELILSPEFEAGLKKLLAEDRSMPFAAAREQTLTGMGGAPELLSKPNNILAVEYIKAVKLFCPQLRCHAIKRVGSGHDSSDRSGIYLSAGEIRRGLAAGEGLEGFIPPAAEKVLSRELENGRNYKYNEKLLLSRLLMLKKQDFEGFAYCSGGLGNALYESLRAEGSIDGAIERVTGKTFARARVRRAVTACVTGNRIEPSGERPGYARLLAADSVGRSMLKQLRGETGIPVITRPADIRRTGGRNVEIFSLCAAAHDLYVLSMAGDKPFVPDEDWTRRPAML